MSELYASKASSMYSSRSSFTYEGHLDAGPAPHLQIPINFERHLAAGPAPHMQIPKSLERHLSAGPAPLQIPITLERAHEEGSEVFSDIASRVEEEITRYGGDDIHYPPVKTSKDEFPEVKLPVKDPHMVAWDGPNDPTNPQNWSIRYKWFITLVAILACTNITFASSAPSAAARSIAAEFHVSAEVSYLVTTTFLLGFVFGPLLWGPGSELVGRRPIIVGSMITYTLFHLGQALAQNMETLLVTRFLCAFFAVAPLTCIGGLIADVWSPVGRGPATSLFTASVFLGPVLGPVVEGFIIQSGTSWRWTFWVMMIFAGVCTAIITITLPETYAPVILLKKAKMLRKQDPVMNKDVYAEHEKGDWSPKGLVNRTLFRTFKMLALEPILILTTVYVAIVYGLLYALLQAIPIIFIGKYGFTLEHEGLIFIGIGIGTAIGSLINWRTGWHYPKLVETWKGFPPPEERLYSSMIGGPVLVIGIFWLGWTGNYPSVPWYVPALSTIFIGSGISLIFISFLSYLADTYLMYSASAFAANTFCRSAVAAAFPLFTVQMFTKLGVNWACTLIGLISLLFVPCPFLFYKYGARIRSHSKFAPCIDLKIAKQLKEEKEWMEGP